MERDKNDTDSGAIDNIILSTIEFDNLISKKFLNESTMTRAEVYEVVMDGIIYTNVINDSVENYLYNWMFHSEKTENKWRSTVNPKNINELAFIVKEIKKLMNINTPGILEYMIEHPYTLEIYNNFIVVVF